MENDNKNLTNEDYYSNASKKVADFFIGYIGISAVIFISYFILASMTLIGCEISTEYPLLSALLFYLITTFALLLTIAVIIFTNIKTKKTRRYITKGVNFALLTFILIPVILFGACLVALGNYNGH
jgi:uncharacterized membrane protein